MDKENKELTLEEKAKLAKREYNRRYMQKYRAEKRDADYWAKKFDEMFPEGVK